MYNIMMPYNYVPHYSVEQLHVDTPKNKGHPEFVASICSIHIIFYK